MKITKTTTLTKEQWQDYIDEVKTAAPIIAENLKKINYEGRGQEDHDDYMASMIVAVAAMEYVKEFAADKVMFAAVKGGIVQ